MGNQRVIIPVKPHPQVIHLLHEGHLGVVKMKSWPEAMFGGRELTMILNQNQNQKGAHLKSAPYRPATNQSGETFEQTFKQSLRVMKWDASSVERTLSNFHKAYINTPHATTNETPAKLFYGRNLRTRLYLTPRHCC